MKKYLRQRFPGLVDFSHLARGILAFYLYGMPSKRLKIIGVTGTNGKTTTCHLITKILEEAGHKVGMASTTTFQVAGDIRVNKTNMTTLSPFGLQKLLHQMVEAGCDYAVVETSSHAIAQYRNWGIRYFAVAMTNVTHEHLDYHKNFEDYLATKTELFKLNPRVAVANLDDPNWEKFMHFTAGRHLTYSQEKRADIVARKILPSTKGTIFTLVTPTFQQSIDFHLTGGFNVSNALCAAAVCYGLDVKAEAIKKGLEAVTSIPGRMEKVDSGQDFTVIIDYAVTPDSLEKLYATLRPNVSGQIIAVLGSCGDRDKTKRPEMGKVVAAKCDGVVVTDEEPYTEDPREIIDQVASGVQTNAKMKLGENYFKIDSRREGIRKALSLAKRGDLVVITGMGAQEFRVVGSKHLPWNDRKVIEEELSKLGYNKK